MNPNIKQQLTIVTTFSKIVAGILFIILPFLGFYLGMKYGKEMNSLVSTPKPQEQVACTLEAKICPDGTSVGRSGPNCEFAACPTQAAVLTTVVCKDNAKYVAISKESSTEDGNDFLIKNKAIENEISLPQCDYYVGKNDFEIKGLEVTYLLGLTDNFLLLDSGTAPLPRGLTVYNLKNRKQVYKDSYSKPFIIKNDVIDYWSPTDKKVTFENCPASKEWLSQGLGAEFESHISVDLPTLTKKYLGEERCVATQG